LFNFKVEKKYYIKKKSVGFKNKIREIRPGLARCFTFLKKAAVNK